ncbi:DgyrCDS13470 [Dimorphilus gyrociliatus]|nr:DgyrCDS13470 [Dimorphilus gyrociliatus]
MFPNKNSYISCNDGWVFDQGLLLSTIASKWNLVCKKSWMVRLTSTIYMFGRFFGAISCGVLSDKIGRKYTVIIYLFFKIGGGFLATYAPNYPLFCIGRYIIAIGTTGSNLAAYVYLSEITGKSYRAAIGVTWQMLFAFGYATLPGIAFFLRDHVRLQLVITAPAIILFGYFFFMDESPRWLISQGRFEEAKQIVEKIATINRKQLPEDLNFSHPASDDKEKVMETRKGTVKDILVYPNLRKKTLILCFIWFTCSLMYYGLSLNIGTIAGSIYLNTFLLGIVEVPALTLGIYLMGRVGRKPTVASACLFAGLSGFILIPLILTDAPSASRTAMSILGKASISMAFAAIYVYTVELMPTGVRNVGIGFTSMNARIAGMAAPYVGGQLSDIWKPFPTTIFGVFATGTGILTLLLPETLNKTLPETIEEGESFGKKVKKSQVEDITGKQAEANLKLEEKY